MKRPPQKDGKSISPNYLISLEEELGNAMAQAHIARPEREKAGRVRFNGVNSGSRGRSIFTPTNNSEEIIRAMELGIDSLAKVNRRDVLNNFQKQISLDKLRGIYNKVRNFSPKYLKDNKLNVLVTLKTVFEEIEKENQARLDKSQAEASMFLESNKGPLGKRTREKMEQSFPSFQPQPPQKRQKTENLWGDFAVSTTAFFRNLVIDFQEPKKSNQEVKVDPDPPKVAIFMVSSPSENATPPSSIKQDRPYQFLNSLKALTNLDSGVFLSVENLIARMKLWNSYMEKCGSSTEDIKKYEDFMGGDYRSFKPEEKRITKYSEYLQASIKKIETLKSEQSKILSGFLYLELAKVEHMVTGENASVDDKGSFLTREARSFWYSIEGLGPRDHFETFANKLSSSGKYKIHSNPPTTPHYIPHQPSNSEGLNEIKRKLYSKIPRIFRVAIDLAGDYVPSGVNFVDTITVPRTVKTSNNFKSNFSSIINTSEYRTENPTLQPTPTTTPSSYPIKRRLSDEAQSVKDKINVNSQGVKKLQRIVDSPIDFSESIFGVTSEIDIAIGVVKPENSGSDSERFRQESEVVAFLGDSKGLLKRGDAARGRSAGLDPRRKNIYAYVAFLDDRIQILQDVVNDLKSANPSQDRSIEELKKMQANLGLELVRISDSFKHQEDFIGQFQAPHRFSWKNTGLDPFGPVHHEDSLKTLRAEAMKKQLGRTFTLMLDKERFEGRKSFNYSDTRVASANQDFLKSKVEEALGNLNKIRSENATGRSGKAR